MERLGFSAATGPLLRLRENFLSGTSRFALRSAVGMVAFAGSAFLASPDAMAACLVVGNVVQCGTTSTTDTTFAANPATDRNYPGNAASPFQLNTDSGSTVSGFGLAVSNAGTGGVTVNNGGTISVDAGNTPTAGGTAALSIIAAGGSISYTGGGIINNGNGNAFDVQQNGAGTTTIDVTGNVTAAAGEGIVVRDTTVGGTISVTAGAVTALDAGRDGIDVQAQSLTGNVTIVANGPIQAGNAGIVGALLQGGATGNINVTANSTIDARFGVDAENFGSGSTTVKTVGAVNATTGNGIFALATGGAVSVTAGDVTSTGNTAIVARQTKAAGTGTIGVTAGNVSGTIGIEATNAGTGATTVTANGTVTGTLNEGIKATGGGAVSVIVANTVTGATRGMTLVGGNGGAGDISVTGAGGFTGQNGDGANIQNNGTGTVTVNISGATNATGGEGIVVRDTTVGGTISVTAGAVTALDAGNDAIDVQAQSLTGNVTIVANGPIQAGNAGIVGALLQGGATGNVDVTANSTINGRFGVDAENFGSGSTTVKTVGAVNATDGNGIFARSGGGNILVTAGDVTADSNTAVVARQTNVAGVGTIDLTVGNVSGTTGIEATNSGTGAISITANGTVAGTLAEGIKATGNGGAVDITTNALVEGTTSAIFARSSGQQITIATNALVRNRSQLSTDLAIDASGGPVVFTNAGEMIGTVKFGAAANIFNNNAGWNTAGGTNDFGGGASTLTNAAGVSIYTAVDGAAVETTAFNGLANFNNSGILTMADGGAGDRTTTSGNASFASGSVYAVDVSGMNQSDLLTVNGSATLNAGSTLDVHLQGNLMVGAHYTVLTATNGVNGEFGSVTGVTNTTAFLKVEDNYDANNVYLDVVKRAFADAGLTPNQISTGRGLDTIPMVGPLFNALAGLMTDTQARATFDQLSGEQHASMTSVLVDDSRFVRSSAIDRLRSSFGSVGAAPTPVMSYAPGGPMMVAPTTDRPVVWGQAFGAWGNLNGDGNAASVRRSTGGLTFGVDAFLFDGWRVGLLGGYSNTSISINGRNSSGKSDNYHIGVYAGSQWGNLSLRTGVAYTWHDISSSRFVAFPGFTDQLSASYGARTAQVFGDLGYRINMNTVAIEPFGNLAYVNLHTEGFREIGGPAALTSRSVSTGVTFTTLGLRASSDFALGGMIATARGSLGWRHAFGDTTPVSTFAFAGGSAFTIAGVPIAQNAAVVEAGLDLRLFPNATIGVAYNGQFASAARDQSVKANLAIKF